VEGVSRRQRMNGDGGGDASDTKGQTETKGENQNSTPSFTKTLIDILLLLCWVSLSLYE